MPLQGSVSRALEGLKAGEETAARELWERYCAELTRQARKKLRHNRRRIADENDIAQNAFLSLCLGARQGRFPDLQDRDSLWRLLVFITAQKAADFIAYEKRKKRGEAKVRGHSYFSSKEEQGGFDAVIAQTPGPATLQVWAEEYEQLLDKLKDDTLKKIAVWRLEGATIDEIADKLGCAHRTVDRKLDLIKKVLLAETKT
jgi:DNA-directed RNA polymerase specialized sigma24 family protein